jgi:hypothetical protein
MAKVMNAKVSQASSFDDGAPRPVKVGSWLVIVGSGEQCVGVGSGLTALKRACDQADMLFPGIRAGKPMTTRQLSRLFHEATDAAGIKKSVTLHALRDDTDIRIIQALLGHDKLDTTARYTRVATGMIAGIESPLDRLSQPRKKPKKAKEKSRKDQPTA